MKATDIGPTEFGYLFAKCRDKFISVASSYVHDTSDAEDIVAEVFTKFWDNRATIEITGSVEAYLLAMVKNKCRDHLRTISTRLKSEGDIQSELYNAIQAEIDVLDHGSKEWLFDSDIRDIFNGVLNELPELRRRIFCAVKFDGLTYVEAAIHLGVSPRKVKREVSAVLNGLRSALKDYL